MSNEPGNGQPVQTLLRNARLVLPERTVENSSLLIQDGSIAKVIESMALPLPTAESVIDLSGLTIFPGFIDVHIHGAMGADIMTAGPADLKNVADFLASRGTTGWLPTLVPAPPADYEHAIGAINVATNETSGARILGVHYEGPFVNSAQCGALRSQYFRSYSDVQSLADLPRLEDPSALHLMTLAPEVVGGIELIRELTSRGWIVSIGHTHANFDQLDAALNAGARHMTHFMNAMPPLHHRSPGPVGWGLAHDDVTCDVIADGRHLEPTMLKLLLKLKGPDQLLLISDAVAAAGLGDGDYQIWGETITVRDGRTSNAAGIIAGSVISLLDAVLMMQSLGASEVELARMSAINPALLLGIEKDYGSLEAGKRADLVALAADGKVVLTMIGGEVVFDQRRR